MAKEKLRLIEKTKKDYFVEVPERVCPRKKSLVRLGICVGEYMYFPRNHTFLHDTRFTSEELRAIADKLDELNKRSKSK